MVFYVDTWVSIKKKRVVWHRLSFPIWEYAQRNIERDRNFTNHCWRCNTRSRKFPRKTHGSFRNLTLILSIIDEDVSPLEEDRISRWGSGRRSPIYPQDHHRRRWNRGGTVTIVHYLKCVSLCVCAAKPQEGVYRKRSTIN